MAADDDATPAESDAPAAEARTFLIAGLAASAGGLEALAALLRALPDQPGLGLVLVLHLAPDRASGISDVLSRTTGMPVREATQGMPVERDHVYVIPPNVEMTLHRGCLWLRPRSDSANPHKPADAFFASLAKDRGRRGVGVVLSGADGDGTRGLRAIKDAGGKTFAQDETARVSGMPASSIASGAVDFIGSPDAIAGELVRLVREPFALEAPEEDSVFDAGTPAEATLGDEHLRQVLGLLQESTGADFSAYKVSTVRRRILRRMTLHRIASAAQFVDLLRETPAERQSLHDDILIHVTRFFRDPEAFRALETRVIPQLIARSDRTLRQPIRVWVPGCATGEEAYSIAIALLEAMDRADQGTVSFQVFGTDLSENAIEKARTAVYPADVVADVAPERLRRFFVPTDSGFQVRKVVRDACIFATHDVSRDPPFSRLDLISCRNLLIYMSGALQKRIVPLLHYGLNPRGFLLLGPAETLGAFGELFVPVDRHWSLYRRAEGSVRQSIPYDPAPRPIERAATSRIPAIAPPADQGLRREADVLLQAYAPPGVITDERLEVIHFLGRTSPYLEPSSGRATHHLLSMAADGLRGVLEDTVRRTQQIHAPTEARAQLERQEITVRVIPLGVSSERRGFLVLFEDPDQVRRSPPSLPIPTGTPDEMSLALSRARHELGALRLQLQSVMEEHQSSQEALQSASEEILSSNEELQSTNEELQTSKEEVESTNEELSTLNDELHARVADLTRLNDDWTNVLASVQIPIVILGGNLRIRSFTAPAGPIFRVIGTDVGRPLTDINIGLQIPDLRAVLGHVLDGLQPTTREVQDESGHWYQLRVRPYRTAENRIDGLVLALIDIDEMKRAADAVEHARDYAEAIIATVRRPLVILDANLRVRTANPEFYRTFAVSPEESEGRVLHELGNRQWDIPALRRHLEEVIPRDQHFDNFEVEHVFPGIGRKIMRMNGRRVEGKADAEEQILIAIDDVTHERDQERGLVKRDRELVEADTRKNEFLAMLAHELRNPLAPIVHAGSLLRRAQGQDPKIIERSAEIIVRQSAHMTRLIEDLLDVARITRGKVTLQRQRVALQTIAESAAEAARPVMEARRHEFEVSLPPEAVEVDGDPARLAQVVSNLLQNAARYTDPGGRVALTLAREGDAGVLRVRDDGIGIPAKLLPSIFELFLQAERDLDRASGGLGIGLTVARSLVEMHGGTIEARSDGPGEGSEFIVRLPLRRDEHHSQVAESPSAEASRPVHAVKRVLVIEDNEDAAEALVALLMQWGHDVRTAGEGLSALSMAREFHPEVVLLDIGLPGMSGYEVAGELRRIPGLDAAFVVAMTGYGQAEDQERSRAAGFDHHLVKPVDVAVLEALLLDPRR